MYLCISIKYVYITSLLVNGINTYERERERERENHRLRKGIYPRFRIGLRSYHRRLDSVAKKPE